MSAGSIVSGQYGLTPGRGLAQWRNPRTMGNDWWSWIQDPLVDWQSEGRGMAAYAWLLVQTDPHAAALLRSRLQLTHGSTGLCFRSTYQLDDEPGSTQRERELQRQITKRIKSASSDCQIDAGGQITRSRFEKLIDGCKIVAGDGFAVRVWNPDRVDAELATCWRIVDPNRVCNPNGVANWEYPGTPGEGDAPPVGHLVWEGIEVNPDRQPVAIWIEHPDPRRVFGKSRYQRVPMHDEDGRRTVIHRFTPGRPGMLRGFSDYAPLFQTCKHLKGVNEAHIIGKRAQASMPIFFRTADDKIAAKFHRQGAVAGPNTPIVPGMMQYIGRDGDVIMSQVRYDGSDYEAHVNVQVRACAAAWGIPYEVVLAVLGKASLASARAQLDQAERTAGEWQEDHIVQVTRPIDASIMAEEIARRRLPLRSVRRALTGYYLRPRGFSTDRAKDAKAVKDEIRNGRDPNAVFARYYGTDFEDELRGHKQARELAAELGVDLPDLFAPEAPAAVTDPDKPNTNQGTAA